MSADLPPALRAALEGLAGRFGGRDLAAASARITADYRAGRGSRLPSPVDLAAYAVARMPATYAACAAALAEAAERTACAPRSVLDVGCGPGTATWAAREAFPSLDRATLRDAHAGMVSLGRDLASEGPPLLSRADWQTGRLGADLPSADLVVASYALNELQPAEVAGAARALHAAAGQLLVLVEPGTPAGFAVIAAARAALLADGARLAAPCPTERPCPVAPPDWCHFSARLPRLRAHKAAKGADVPFEDERFAYLVAVRPGIAVTPAAARILRPPRADKAGTTFALCTPAGAVSRTVPSRDRDHHRLTRRLGWGDAFDIEPPEPP
ncbi:small ribosomal subunit Rsm22 family protein [Phreatobacter cathodiphilus]|uniref:SAM-dependent methyltransferase n=1 Tax=Phreatobacter cathodiphilus TaxID=1868589 RepID=A0A2S0NA14_9HYPH|nr:small ribosomal subunit Rsm22 family protein [Phreatobacter cathodiphilus]AVO44988.1 SAM-dependent methyltransferase [Phreatobacter cathodiphilus]